MVTTGGELSDPMHPEPKTKVGACGRNHYRSAVLVDLNGWNIRYLGISAPD